MKRLFSSLFPRNTQVESCTKSQKEEGSLHLAWETGKAPRVADAAQMLWLYCQGRKACSTRLKHSVSAMIWQIGSERAGHGTKVVIVQDNGETSNPICEEVGSCSFVPWR